MNRSIEDRLVAALEARAELVTPEDLGPIQVPDCPRRPRRRAAVLLLVAAASAAVVVTPFVLGGGGGAAPEPDPAGPPSVGVSETTESSPTTESTAPSEPSTQPSTQPGDVVVSGRQRADVDADGRPDDVQVLLDSPTPDEPGDGLVEVSLATGGTGTAEMPFGYPPTLLPALDINGDGREQVLLSHTAGGDEAQLLVYTWHEGGLIRVRPDRDVPLALALDGQGRVTDYHADDRGLVSWRRLDPVDPSGGPRFNVEEWSWSVDGDRLMATPAGYACVDVTVADPPQPCTGQPDG